MPAAQVKAVGSVNRRIGGPERTLEPDGIRRIFYYYRVRGGKAVHPHGLTFGDELRVSSRVFRFGRRSVFSVHRLAPADLDLADTPLEAAEVYESPHPDCMYAENFNRWIARGRPDSNRGLVEVVPPDFTSAHLPRLPDHHSLRTLVGRARETGGFCVPAPRGFAVAGPEHTFEYALDVVRDINGAGLVYLASFFSIFNTVLLRLWRSLGRSDEEFLRRHVIDQKVGYFGNADPGAVFTITARRWRNADLPDIEIADMTLRDSSTNRLLAATAIEIDKGPTGALAT
ncbi:LnmK family bifunctional acyltransferase/decarboxylase [Actinomadura sp. 7K507]|uniref:LnmK family bifunctional acyltransferase/decarboxylase n=1 Tax=Actinomadura sp. 7K507 TaxID=2530365 RepID=UPI001A9F87E0|nr:LnmK family bifunctional acyltransferase/decarboxylase [Actinomadura sp. 7K507]